jgi:hypothetical protein
MSFSSVTSEILQAKLRELLPSQQGFGTDLSASDTIIPIIDLTATAEGASTPAALQNAISFADQTAFIAQSSTVTIANTTGFYRVVAGITNGTDSSGSNEVQITMDDGSTTKVVYAFTMGGTAKEYSAGVSIDLVFWLDAGVTLKATTNDGTAVIAGSSRQIADSNGTFSNPTGFTPS